MKVNITQPNVVPKISFSQKDNLVLNCSNKKIPEAVKQTKISSTKNISWIINIIYWIMTLCIKLVLKR